MSHTAKIQGQMTNQQAIAAACSALKMVPPTQEKAYRFYDGKTAAGTAVRLPGWQYPVVIGADGSLAYDNYNGAWGKQTALDQFRQQYSLAVIRQTMGATHRITTTTQADGTLRVTLTQ